MTPRTRVRRRAPDSRRVAAACVRSLRGMLAEGVFALALAAFCGALMVIVFLAGG
ncbi:MAG: hypothetical protein Q7W44_02590 [Coriobacteriia bacterium]|nr:hypothetical protein [Coriobacteriia bacterium]